jgi:hypothetical protein
MPDLIRGGSRRPAATDCGNPAAILHRAEAHDVAHRSVLFVIAIRGGGRYSVDRLLGKEL